MREENHRIPLSGLTYLHQLEELGHKYLSANLITKSLEIKKKLWISMLILPLLSSNKKMEIKTQFKEEKNTCE